MNKEDMEVVFEDVEQQEEGDDGWCFGNYSAEDEACEVCRVQAECKKDIEASKKKSKKI